MFRWIGRGRARLSLRQGLRQGLRRAWAAGGPTSGLGVIPPRLEAFAEEEAENHEDPREKGDG